MGPRPDFWPLKLENNQYVCDILSHGAWSNLLQQQLKANILYQKLLIHTAKNVEKNYASNNKKIESDQCHIWVNICNQKIFGF